MLCNEYLMLIYLEQEDDRSINDILNKFKSSTRGHILRVLQNLRARDEALALRDDCTNVPVYRITNQGRVYLADFRSRLIPVDYNSSADKAYPAKKSSSRPANKVGDTSHDILTSALNAAMRARAEVQ